MSLRGPFRPVWGLLRLRRLTRTTLVALLTGLVSVSFARSAGAQAAALISPGPLSRPHGTLEGIANCQKCHEPGQKVTAGKCLACHAPVSARMAKKKGIHRNVTRDCVQCHTEHSGVDGVLRPFDEARFDHAGVAQYPLTGGHAPVANKCAACHKSRSFLTLSRDCATCHRDAHKGAYGNACTKCHSPRTTFKEISGDFDHSKARFRLTGAHTTTACAKCHVNNVLKGLTFSTCAGCHRNPHPSSFSPTCTSCHTTSVWRTSKVDHSRTNFPLRGRHARIDCSACHKRSAGEERAGARLAAFRNASRTCASCHRDTHLGQVGNQCERCHGETSFAVSGYRHTGLSASVFSAGRHGRARCSACHKRTTGVFPLGRGTAVRFDVDSRCTTCHKDVHRGSLGSNCLRCHKP